MSIKFDPIEPIMNNRWIIKTYPTGITPYLFRKYKIYNDGADIIFKTQFYETVNETVNPVDLLNITNVNIEYVDPTGNLVGGIMFNVKGINFKQKHSYSEDGLKITKLRMIIDGIHKIELPNVESTEQPISYGEPKE